MSVPSEPSGQTPERETHAYTHTHDHRGPAGKQARGDPGVVAPTKDVVSQHAGVGEPVDVFALRTVPDEFAAVGNIPWKQQRNSVTHKNAQQPQGQYKAADSQ